MNHLLFVFPIFILVMCFAFEAYGVEFYEVHDFAEPDDPFSVEAHSIFSYDRDGNITVDGRPQGYFRLPGLPHEYNDVGFSEIKWQFCLKPGLEKYACCSGGIQICFNHNPGYVANCDKWLTLYDDSTTVHREFGYSFQPSEYMSFPKSNLDSGNCLHLKGPWIGTAYLVGGRSLGIFGPIADALEGRHNGIIETFGCDAYVKISGEKIPKCVWRWVAQPELQCDNRFGGEEAMEISYELEIGWTLTNAQSTGGSEKWGQSGSVSGTHTSSLTGSGEFKPTIEGTSIFSIGGSGSSSDSKTNTTGWNHETMKSWAEITTRGTQFTEKITKTIKCKKGEFMSLLQKVWTCGDYVVKTGMFKLWDMNMTKERYAQEAGKWKVETVFLSDLNITTHVPDKANTTDAPTNVTGKTVPVSTTVLLAIPALLLLWLG
ncbi:hypothetical protein Ddc_12890 [Ditylenchus destructor]|nr:hypothetical protein Ddc_12890 [Ditylenchus destructor]